MTAVRARRAVSDDRQREEAGMASRPASTPSVLYHRKALLSLAVSGVQARHHATGGRFHGTAVRLPFWAHHNPGLRTPRLRSRRPERRQVHNLRTTVSF